MLEPPEPCSFAVATAVYLTVDTDLDTHAAAALSAQIAGAFEQTEQRVVLDCSGVDWVDSSGLRVLLEATRLGNARDINVVVSKPSAVLLRLFTLADVAGYLHIDDTADDCQELHTTARASRGAAVHSFPVPHTV